MKANFKTIKYQDIELGLEYYYVAGNTGNYFTPPTADDLNIIGIFAGEQDISEIITDRDYQAIEEQLLEQLRNE